MAVQGGDGLSGGLQQGDRMAVQGGNGLGSGLQQGDKCKELPWQTPVLMV